MFLIAEVLSFGAHSIVRRFSFNCVTACFREIAKQLLERRKRFRHGAAAAFFQMQFVLQARQYHAYTPNAKASHRELLLCQNSTMDACAQSVMPSICHTQRSHAVLCKP